MSEKIKETYFKNKVYIARCVFVKRKLNLVFPNGKRNKNFRDSIFFKMKNKYSKEEKNVIVLEAENCKDKAVIASKYNIHLSTLYGWISDLRNQNNRNYFIGIKLSKEEKNALDQKCKALGYGKDVSSYVRKRLFSKDIATGNPKEIIDELYKARGEINKAGTNLNQIANYTNFLKGKGYFEDGYIKDLEKVIEGVLTKLDIHKEVIDRTIKKI